MSSANTTRPVELTAIVIGVLAIFASAYFIFMTDWNAYRLTNWVISIAFLVFVVYNFINVRNLRGEVEELSQNNDKLSGELATTQQSLTEAKADLEVIKADLIAAQSELQKREAEIEKLKA
jgi:septal ring factor EnvC (AmiA/AmiB activator)